MSESKGGVAVDLTETFTFPCSYAQQRLWFLDQMEPGSALYNLPVAVRLKGYLNSLVLERSLQEIVCRHETLRTSFGYVDVEPVQIIRQQAEIRLASVDISSLDAHEREQRAREIALEEAEQSFNLNQGP